jgi:hypothetical protein
MRNLQKKRGIGALIVSRAKAPAITRLIECRRLGKLSCILQFSRRNTRAECLESTGFASRPARCTEDLNID